MDQNIIECGGFYFIHNFDSGNLGHVERVPTELIAPAVNAKTNTSETPDYEFNLWTRPDCAGTEFENGNRTWFYFGVQASTQNVLVRLNLINLNKQGKMYNQGMAPVTRTLPGKPQWERIRDRPIHSTDDNTFSLSFKYRTSDNIKATTFFAFTYPYSFAELQIALNSIDLKMLPIPPPQSPDEIYYHRECLVYSLEGRRVDLLTITSHHGIRTVREDRLKNLFPDKQERPFKFENKKVIFISARVHPGETPSSFVFNGFLNLLLTRNDPIAIQLRKLYVFKLIPFLNPDGVARGQYRTDTRGVNLNRVYLNPSLTLHPTVYASRALIRYYHFGCEKEDKFDDRSVTSRSVINISDNSELETKKKKGSKDSYLRREKTKSPKKERNRDATNLAEQVCDMKIQEVPSHIREPPRKQPSISNADTTSILNDSTLRACLDSNVHISTSEELNIPNNPLRPLRDALKNSLSLLMGSTAESSMCAAESHTSNVKIGWCQECRGAVSQLEETMPGIRDMVPGYSSVRSGSPSNLPSPNPTFHSIDEYRESQMQQFNDSHERKLLDMECHGHGESNVYFCTNCFKRYIVTDTQEEIKLVESSSSTSVAASCGDSGDAPAAAERAEPAGTDIDKVPPKEEKPKSAGKPLKKRNVPPPVTSKLQSAYKEVESGLYLYIDLHGHASKKGIFMYGNHFEDADSSIECMLLPRIMSLNSLHFHFSSCNFTERNMYLKDRRDGMSREGSGRVAVLKATGLVRSYTLECNYNTGRLVNVLPPALKEPAAPAPTNNLPPKYTPHIFEEVGRSLGASILDLTGQHPNSRIPGSEHRNLSTVREWLRAHTRNLRPNLTMSRLRPKVSSPSPLPHFVRSKAKVVDERKENTYLGGKPDERRRSPALLAPRSGHDIIDLNMKYVKKTEPVKSTSRTRYLVESEPKPKNLTSKRWNILSVRKPNSGKTQAGVVKGKIRRSADDTDSSRTMIASKLSKRSFGRSMRGATRSNNRCRPMASSSSEDMPEPNWEELAGGTLTQNTMSRVESMAAKRRPFPNHSPSQLKKIRLKTAM